MNYLKPGIRQLIQKPGFPFAAGLTPACTVCARRAPRTEAMGALHCKAATFCSFDKHFELRTKLALRYE
jgi:hypothetical protein